MKTKYTIDYFIDKFKKIPENKWCVGNYILENGKKCVLGHCGANEYECMTEEGKYLITLFANNDYCVLDINDKESHCFPQKTPKKRILACLKFFKKKFL